MSEHLIFHRKYCSRIYEITLTHDTEEYSVPLLSDQVNEEWRKCMEKLLNEENVWDNSSMLQSSTQDIFI